MQKKRSPVRRQPEGAKAFEYGNRASETTEARCDFQAKNCQNCAYFEYIIPAKGKGYTLCHLNGERYPYPHHHAGCHFLQGAWAELDQILGLTNSRAAGKLAVPNLAGFGNGLVYFPRVNKEIADKTHTAIHSLAGLSGKGLNHTSRGMTSGFPRGASSFARARERHAPALFNSQKSSEAHR